MLHPPYISRAEAAAGRHLEQLLTLPDGDTYLEAAALLSTALSSVSQQHATSSSAGSSSSSSSSSSSGGSSSSSSSSSVARAYLATLPQDVPLPLFAGGGGGCCSRLLDALPALQRLSSSRRQGLTLAWASVQPLLRAVCPDCGAGLSSLSACSGWRAWLWAHSLARTRTVGLTVDRLPSSSRVRKQLEAVGVAELGVLVPVLDLANHGSGLQVG
jgi:hypothetical protein